MLNLLACIAVATWTTVQDAGHPHLRVIPEQVTGFVALNDLPDLLDKGRQNSWYRYFLDPQLAEFRDWFDLKLEEMESEAEQSGLPSPAQLATSIQAASVFVVPAPGTPVGALGIVVQAREKHEALRQLIDTAHGEMAAESEVSISTWNEVDLRVYAYTEAGEGLDGPGTIASFELDGLFVFIAAEATECDLEHVLGVARDCIDRIAEDGPGVLANQRYREARATGSVRAHVEGFVDVPSLTSFIPSDRDNEPIVAALVASISSVPWVYGSARLGAGEELDAQLGFRCDPNSLLGQLLGLSRPVPQDMLKLMPSDSVAISIGAFDMRALVDLTLGGIARFGPEGAQEKVTTRLELLQGQFGVDPIEDFVLMFSGEFAFFQRLPDDPQGVDLVASPGQVFSMLETMVFGLRDGDALAENLEQVLTMTGLEAYLEVDDFDDVDIYSLPPALDVPLSWTITEDFLAISGRREDIEHLIRAASQPQTSVLDDERLAAAFEQARAATLFSLSDTAAVLKMMGEVFDVIAATSNVTADAAEFGEAMSFLGSHGVLAPGLIDKYFDGLMYSSWTVDEGRVRLQTWGR